jgi:predicted neutral ceramidase superfamily lipid hydrolase
MSLGVLHRQRSSVQLLVALQRSCLAAVLMVSTTSPLSATACSLARCRCALVRVVVLLEITTFNAPITTPPAFHAGCPVMEAWTALLTGLGAGVVYRYSSKLLLKLRIDVRQAISW